VRVETLLPLGKLDPGLRAADTPLDLGRVIEAARLVESLGYDGLAVEETKNFGHRDTSSGRAREI
jgi:hypothetical protein